MAEIKKIKLGSQGFIVSTIGLSCMGMTTIGGPDIYRKADESEAFYFTN